MVLVSWSADGQKEKPTTAHPKLTNNNVTRNRYPGARFDSESFSYIFSFSQELLDEWSWTEHFAPQPETLKYVNFMVDKFDLKRSMQFNTRIKSMKFRDDSNSWLLVDQNGQEYTTRYVVTAIGILNEPTLPAIPGVDDYRGEAWHTARWPGNHEVGLRGKRVGIIGTGATGIQTIQEIYKDCGSLTVFQRTPNWTAPIRNSKISPEEMNDIRKRYPEIFQACLESSSCFVHKVNPKKTTEWDREELLAHFEELYLKPGFAKVLGIPVDIFMDREANKLYSDFIASKIRPRIKDPTVAEKLIPKCHGFMTRRVPLENGYYEAFNEPHVRLVDLKETPIDRITEKGVRLAAPATNGNGDQPKLEELELDVLIYATGFDATTGSFRAIDIQGVDGKRLWEDTWANCISTYLGVAVPKFPNMFMAMGKWSHRRGRNGDNGQQLTRVITIDRPPSNVWQHPPIDRVYVSVDSRPDPICARPQRPPRRSNPRKGRRVVRACRIVRSRHVDKRGGFLDDGRQHKLEAQTKEVFGEV